MTAVHLDLKNHCIETEIKRQYNRVLNTLLRSGKVDPTLENQLGLLTRALQEFDFSRLRSETKVLAGGCSGNEVQLREGAAGGVDLFINGTRLENCSKKNP